MKILINSISNYRITFIIFFFCGLLIRRATSNKFALLIAAISFIMIIQFLFFRYRHYKMLSIPDIKRKFIMEGLMLIIGDTYNLLINYLSDSSGINFMFILSLSIFFIPSQLANNKIKKFEKINDK